ncbi:hypothetical protein [Azospirillum canadense]|uniref:hypothetical protein n=1 Tax=Azospirillum canadense TaxID=403962 RepID=UPI002227B220|nr:hypothetical protein [Azospirillum canadense]
MAHGSKTSVLDKRLFPVPNEIFLNSLRIGALYQQAGPTFLRPGALTHNALI